MTIVDVVRRIHLWAGVLLGIQVLLWMLSGVVMSWFHIELVRGERSAPVIAEKELEISAYASPGGVIAQSGGAYSVELRTFLGRPVYEVRGVDGVNIFDARTGDQLSPITESTARRVARNGFVGEGAIKELSLVDDAPQEYRGSVPVWRAQFDDSLNTRLYISEDTGEIVSRRNDIWRFYDFFWMLHIMDYEERHDFNNPLLRIASAAGLVFAISGLVMIFFKKSRRTLVADVRRVAGRKG